MKFVKYLVFTFAIFCVIAFLLPKDKYVNRTIEINQEIDFVFDQVNTLKNWENWSAWSKSDTSALYTYSKKTSGIGAWQEWKSNVIGEGKLTIVESKNNQLITTNLDFYNQGEGDEKWEFSSRKGITTVSWTYHADLGYNPLARWIGLFLDSMLGQSLDQSLQSLKTYCQNAIIEQKIDVEI
jgi:hypothetical protein